MEIALSFPHISNEKCYQPEHTWRCPEDIMSGRPMVIWQLRFLKLGYCMSVSRDDDL